jgi:plasmid stability protein
MATVSIKNVPEDIVRGLKAQAAENHRSLQGEVLSILEEAMRRRSRASIDDLLGELRRIDLPTEPRSVDIIRADRDGNHGR